MDEAKETKRLQRKVAELELLIEGYKRQLEEHYEKARLVREGKEKNSKLMMLSLHICDYSLFSLRSPCLLFPPLLTLSLKTR